MFDEHSEIHRLETELAEAKRVTFDPAVLEQMNTLEKDAARYRWMRGRLMGADFDWNESGASALVFEMPMELRISANCDKTIDDAMALTTLTPNALAQADAACGVSPGAMGSAASDGR